MPAPADREKALDTALAQIDKQFGKGSVMRLGDDVRAPIEVIPTGSVALDVALGLGGTAAWLIVTQVFDFEWLPNWPRVFATLGGGLVLVLGFAFGAALPLLRAKPARALRAL